MIRPYQYSDRSSVLEIFQLNTPEYFAPEEERDFISYLDDRLEDYFVIEIDGKIVGSGGINYIDAHEARISWDLIHPDHQGKGLGQVLLNHRIQHIKEKGLYMIIKVHTSQLAFQFYAKYGSKLTEEVTDYWSKGYDLYNMEFNLT